MTFHVLAQPIRRLPFAFALAALLSLAVIALPGASAQTAVSPPRTVPLPTVVLVHGAFADASGWNDVTKRLQKKGYTVYAPANPLRGLAGDSAYLRGFLTSLAGPVVLVGHSYGGAVISNAATGNPNVTALVYIAGYALAEGEDVAHANNLGGHPEESLLLANIQTRQNPQAEPGNDDVYINPNGFHEVFAADVPVKDAAVMAASQRPAALFSLFAPSGTPAWESIPSWYLVASQDRAIPPTAERAMAERAGATTVEIDSSHLAMVSHPGEVTSLIQAASGHR